MDMSKERILAILEASALAGPVFLTCLVAAMFWDLVPRPISIEPAFILQFFIALAIALSFGTIIAFVPVAVGTLAMSALAERWEAARALPAWAAAGAACGGILVLLVGAQDANAFALVATSLVCAVVSRRCVAA